MPWTNNQLKAINNKGHNIIVSAGAGSGKTTVLKERVLNKLNYGINVNELLILTFTNASAKEMKERIKKVIKANNLKEQEELLDSSYITTFDSFSLSLVKKYHYKLGIDKNISIVDNSIIEFEQRKILDDIFIHLYDIKDNNFITLIKTFVLKDDKELKNAILNMNNKIALRYGKYEYLNDYISKLDSIEYKESLIKAYKKCIDNKIEELRSYIDELISISPVEYQRKIEESPFMRLFNENLSLDESLPLLRDFSLPKLPNKSEEEIKNIKNLISDTIKKLKPNLVSSTQDLTNQIENTKKYVLAIIEILIELNKKKYFLAII